MSTVSFLAGLGAGYLQEDDKQIERKRQAMLDKITTDRAQRETTQAQRETDQYNLLESNQTAMRTAAAPLPVETVGGMGPPTEDGASPAQSYRVGAANFADQGAAATASIDPVARDARIASVMRGIDPTKAQSFEASTKQAKLTDVQLKQHIQTAQDEGTMRALSAALAGKTPAEVEGIFNSSGETKVHNLKFTPINVNHPVLGPQKSLRITGTRDDGQPFVLPDAVDASFMLFSAEKRFGMQIDANKEATKNKKDDRTATREEAAQRSLSKYHDVLGDAAGVKAAKPGRGDPVERMTGADAAQYKTLGKQIEMTDSEIVKGIKSGEFSEASKDGSGPPEKNAAWKTLEMRLAASKMQSKAILKKYEEEDSAPDPIGLRKPAVNASGGSGEMRVSPGTQDARDAAGGKMMVMSEFGGDVNRARSELALMQDGIRKAPNVEAKSMLQSQARILQLGINAMGTTPAPARMAAGGVATPSAAPAARAAPASVPAAAPVVPQYMKTTGDATLNAMQAKSMASLAVLTDAVTQAKQQLAAVAKSGDPAALSRYATILQKARDARTAAANEALGNNAPQYLASVDS